MNTAEIPNSGTAIFALQQRIAALTKPPGPLRFRPNFQWSWGGTAHVDRVVRSLQESEPIVMKVRNSLKTLHGRHRDNRLVRRKGRLYVINKTQKRFKARQG